MQQRRSSIIAVVELWKVGTAGTCRARCHGAAVCVGRRWRRRAWRGGGMCGACCSSTRNGQLVALRRPTAPGASRPAACSFQRWAGHQHRSCGRQPRSHDRAGRAHAASRCRTCSQPPPLLQCTHPHSSRPLFFRCAGCLPQHHPLRHRQAAVHRAEGVYSGQYIYCGKKATLNIGNVKPVRLLVWAAVLGPGRAGRLACIHESQPSRWVSSSTRRCAAGACCSCVRIVSHS